MIAQCRAEARLYENRRAAGFSHRPLRGSDEEAGYTDLGLVRVCLAKRAEEWQWWNVHDHKGDLSAAFRPNRTLAIDGVLLPGDERGRI